MAQGFRRKLALRCDAPLATCLCNSKSKVKNLQPCPGTPEKAQEIRPLNMNKLDVPRKNLQRLHPSGTYCKGRSSLKPKP